MKKLLLIGTIAVLNGIQVQGASQQEFDTTSVRSGFTKTTSRAGYNEEIRDSICKFAALFKDYHVAPWKSRPDEAWSTIWAYCNVPQMVSIVKFWLKEGRRINTLEDFSSVIKDCPVKFGTAKKETYEKAEEQFFKDVYAHMNISFPPENWPEEKLTQRGMVYAALQAFLVSKQQPVQMQDVCSIVVQEGPTTMMAVHDDSAPLDSTQLAGKHLLPNDHNDSEEKSAKGGCCTIL